MEAVSTEEIACLPPGLFAFTGQASFDAWTIGHALKEVGWSRYEYVMAHEQGLVYQRIRELVDAFPTWQHRADTGRPAFDERDILLCLIIRQYEKATFRRTESFLRLVKTELGLTRIPDASTMSRKNSSWRFRRLLERFHHFVLSTLPERKAVIATDATGFGRGKRSWRKTPFKYRAGREYVKANCAVEVPQRIILSPTLTPGRRFESATFEKTWDNLPSNVTPTRSLADSAYSGQPCLEIVRRHGATPFHDLPKNARLVRWPKTERQKMVHFARHWPNRFTELTIPRVIVETTFSNLKELFGDRLRCRTRVGRDSEVWSKVLALNIRIILFREWIAGVQTPEGA
jgi:hypothetical protein